jgi:hypothetical protein
LIDFRYHLVSIVAVFLALAIGIVVGSTALRGVTLGALNAASQSEVKNNEALRADNNRLRAQVSAGNAFAQAGEGYLLNHLLQGEQVVLVLAPGADSTTVTGITAALKQAGAAVTGQVNLQPQFFDTGATTEQALTNLASAQAPPGVTLPGPAAGAQIPGQQAAAQVLAAAMMSKNGQAVVTPAEGQRIINGFGAQGFLQVAGPNGGTALSGPATLAVIVIPNTIPPASSGDSFNLALVSLTQYLDQAGNGALLAGPIQGSGTGSAIDAVTSGAAGVSLTTVDNADTAPGQIMVAQALRLLLDPHATPAAYGVGPGSAPSPAPSTSPSPAPGSSPSSSPTPSHSAKKTVKT